MSESVQDVLDPSLAEKLVFNDAGLIPAIVQQYDSKEVLMMGWMDDIALARTLTTGRVWFYSRSRREYWRKGDTSGHVQYVKSAAMDCDADVLLITVDQIGVACHTGTRTCFTGRELEVVVGNADQAEETK
ncbi:phosphoribosyl-AMP cyclohydrolase [Neomicrococcus aestuarii]|uniref:Phosphoribosyl-AMP cyclohydrolase n=1 Tax=Neomicrococcus aestuarii TaxID=556325 RepID=A0A7W8TX88_9MICC|nr:phosphoribosyl-AMP cyclohydrolase [Neomicrococcus aestuarii]MBB5513850.1 phosphoribosyl-AMP cyclohydrolase [Neomicrococcus aestuarii]